MVAQLGLESGAGDEPAAADDASAAGRSPASKAPRAPSSVQINRMIRALVVRRLEQMTETPMENGEQEQKLLDIISRTMNKLEGLDRARKDAAGSRPRRSSKGLLELRRQIADRIDQLNED